MQFGDKICSCPRWHERQERWQRRLDDMEERMRVMEVLFDEKLTHIEASS